MNLQIHKSLDSDQQVKFLDVCRKELGGKYNQYIMYFLCLYYTGGRSKEVLGITPKDLKFGRNPNIFLRGAKGSNDRSIPIPIELGDKLKSMCDALGADDKLFSFSYGHARDRFKYIFNFGLGLHCFRHTFGVNMYRKSKDIFLVQSLLGHKNINNTTVYVNYCTAQDALKSTFRKMGVMCQASST